MMPRAAFDERQRAAIHEAGHAVVAYRLGVVATVIELGRGDDSGWGNTKFPTEWNMRYSLSELHDDCQMGQLEAAKRAWVEQQVMVLLAGGLAEMELTSRPPEQTGSYQQCEAGTDVEMAWLHVEATFDDDHLGAVLMDDLEARTAALVATVRAHIDTVAAALLKSGRLYAHDLRRLLQQA